MSEKQETWRSRVVDWRASGKTAAEFSARHGFGASSLRWWSSRLQREAPATALATPAASPVVRLAKVLRSPEPAFPRGTVVVEMLDARVRILVQAGVDRETLAIVLDLAGRGGTR